jgi:hypothetical protein
MTIIPTLRRQRKEDHSFEASLDFIVRLGLKKKKAGLVEHRKSDNKRQGK